MLIGLISDTHIPGAAKALPSQIKEVFRNVDLILHAGDIYTVSVLDELECLSPVLAARGDNDPTEGENDKRVKWKQILTINGLTICLKHMLWWWPDEPKSAFSPVPPRYEELPDILVYGHSHVAAVENRGRTLLINPGSATFPNYKFGLGTVVLLRINSGKAEAEIIQL
jgi:putative phosphoesterase